MKTVLIANSKGGVGKTLIADELCWKLEKDQIKYSFVNLDNQGSAYHETFEDPEAVVKIVDTPGNLTEGLAAWLKEADFIIVPTMMSRQDKEPLERMIRILESLEKKIPVLYVFNRWDRFNFTKDFMNYYHTVYPEIKTAILANTVAFSQAGACGISLEEYQPNNIACKHIDHIYSSIKYELNLRGGLNG